MVCLRVCVHRLSPATSGSAESTYVDAGGIHRTPQQQECFMQLHSAPDTGLLHARSHVCGRNFVLCARAGQRNMLEDLQLRLSENIDRPPPLSEKQRKDKARRGALYGYNPKTLFRKPKVPRRAVNPYGYVLPSPDFVCLFVLSFLCGSRAGNDPVSCWTAPQPMVCAGKPHRRTRTTSIQGYASRSRRKRDGCITTRTGRTLAVAASAFTAGVAWCGSTY